MNKLRRIGHLRYAMFLAWLGVSILASGCISVDLQSLVNPELKEKVLDAQGRWTKHKVLIVDISGEIASGTQHHLSFLTDSSPEKVKAILKKAEEDSGIKAIVLRIDSPGGEVTATDMIYHELIDFKRRTGIPVVASIMGLGCSGAYYVACAADKVYAHPTSITGSIGIIARFPKLAELANKIGYQEEIFTTGKLKAMGHPLRQMTPEVRQVLQSAIDDLFDRFLSVLMSSRKAYKKRDDAKKIADGQIFTAYQALDLGLIDEVAYISDVIKKTKQSLGISEVKIITYSGGSNQDLNIYSKILSHNRTPINVVNFDLSPLVSRFRPGFYYLWLPNK